MVLKRFQPIIFFSIIFLVVWIGSGIYNNRINKELEEFGVTTVAKIYEVKYGGARNRSYKIKYYYNNVLYHSGIPVESENPNKNLNKYFQLIISSKNPKICRINFDKEIINISEIVHQKLK